MKEKNPPVLIDVQGSEVNSKKEGKEGIEKKETGTFLTHSRISAARLHKTTFPTTNIKQLIAYFYRA